MHWVLESRPKRKDANGAQPDWREATSLNLPKWKSNRRMLEEVQKLVNEGRIDPDTHELRLSPRFSTKPMPIIARPIAVKYSLSLEGDLY